MQLLSTRMPRRLYENYHPLCLCLFLPAEIFIPDAHAMKNLAHQFTELISGQCDMGLRRQSVCSETSCSSMKSYYSTVNRVSSLYNNLRVGTQSPNVQPTRQKTATRYTSRSLL